ncbi:MAG: NYN domain-containing protein [Chloroflexota bacterium]
MPYLIDGHNLIHHLDDIDIKDPHDEAKLVLKLRGFCEGQKKKVVVVFDYGLPGGYSQLSTSRVQVVFSSAIASDADTIIRQRIRKIRDIKGWTVVSSDNEILTEAKHVGMRGIRCAEFADILERPQRTKPHKGVNPNVMVSNNEVEEWLELFGVSADETFAHMRPKPEDRADSKERQPQIKRHFPKKVQRNKSQTQSSATPKRKSATELRAEARQQDVEAWLDIFDENPDIEPTDKAQKIVPRGKKKKRKPTPQGHADTPENVEEIKGGSLSLSDNSVEAWMDVFGGEPEKTRKPTDPALGQNDPSKQGRYRNADGKREPTVHKRMATSDEVYLNDGEVDAWMDVFGATDEDD